MTNLTEADLARYTHGKIIASGVFGWRVPLGGVLKSRAGKIFHAPNPLKGFPDFAGVTKTGQFWALELKSAKGRLSIEQKSWIAKLRDHGCLVAVAKTVDDVNLFFKSLG